LVHLLSEANRSTAHTFTRRKSIQKLIDITQVFFRLQRYLGFVQSQNVHSMFFLFALYRQYRNVKRHATHAERVTTHAASSNAVFCFEKLSVKSDRAVRS